jgi:hypothetical protein
LLQDQVQTGEVLSVVDVVVRAVIIEGDRAGEPEALERFDGPTGGRNERAGAEQRDQERERANQSSFSR